MIWDGLNQLRRKYILPILASSIHYDVLVRLYKFVIYFLQKSLDKLLNNFLSGSGKKDKNGLALCISSSSK